jgi:hypothetical protein
VIPAPENTLVVLDLSTPLRGWGLGGLHVSVRFARSAYAHVTRSKGHQNYYREREMSNAVIPSPARAHERCSETIEDNPSQKHELTDTLAGVPYKGASTEGAILGTASWLVSGSRVILPPGRE